MKEGDPLTTVQETEAIHAPKVVSAWRTCRTDGVQMLIKSKSLFAFSDLDKRKSQRHARRNNK